VEEFPNGGASLNVMQAIADVTNARARAQPKNTRDSQIVQRPIILGRRLYDVLLQDNDRLAIDLEKSGEIMGGIGSGRQCKNALESSFFHLDVRDLHLQGELSIGATVALEWKRDHKLLSRAFIAAKDSCLAIRLLQWHANGTLSDAAQTVDFVWTACRYGGKRPWFICPQRIVEGDLQSFTEIVV
jgi:hypothetical protein